MCWNPCPLSGVAPLVVHYAGPKQAILAVTTLGDAPSIEFLDTFLDSVLDGCVVGVIAVDQSIGAIDGGYDSAGGIEHEKSIPDQATGSSNPAVLRTATGIPFLSSSNGTTSPLAPDRSFSLGQALVRGLDPTNQTLHLLTPIPTSTLQAHSPNIVLVRGTLDTPTWAYKEDFEFEKAKRRLRERRLKGDEGFDGEEMRKWAEGQAWAGVVEGGRRSSGKVRRVRRDIRFRPVGEAGE